MAKYNPFGQGAADQNTVNNVQMRADTGELTPLSGYPSLRGAGESSGPMMNANDDMFVFDPNLGAPSPTNYGAPSMPMYNNGVPAAADSSVTIFPIDGAASAYQSAPMNNYAMDNFSPNPSPAFDGMGNQIFFAHGSSRLGGGDQRALKNIAEQAKFAPVNRVTVAGYASPPTQVGTQTVEAKILNLKESMNRSFAVASDLMREGVPAEKIKAVGWGATKSTGNNENDRRVDIIMGEQ